MLNGNHDSDAKENGINGVIKQDIDQPTEESDARHEPLLAKLDPIDDASVVPELGTPMEAESIPIHPPHGTPPPEPGHLLEEVQMAEETDLPPPSTASSDVVMGDADAQSPGTTPGIFDSTSPVNTNGTSTYTTPAMDTPATDMDEDKPPPAKRPRVHSDADHASVGHSATPPPPSTITSNGATPVPTPIISSTPTLGLSTLGQAQHRFCLSTIRNLKKLKEAAPFLRPVDPIILNIPHYPSIIKTPMDFSTVERKLIASNPTKADPNPHNPRYLTLEEFAADVRLIFQNCRTFNGPDHVVTIMGNRVEEVFDKQIKNAPIPESKPPPRKLATTPPPPALPPKKVPPPRRNSTVVPAPRRSDPEAIGRPKREIHPPPPKDLAYADAPKKPRKSKMKDDGTLDQLRFCAKLLSDMHKKQHYNMASPFYEPVDWHRLELPAYPKIVKRPMDLSTIKRKLDNREYSTAERFLDDFKLMIRNCFSFNPAGTPVNQAGIDLQRFFDERWKSLPSLREVATDDDDEEDEEEETERDRQRRIAAMESEIEAMRNSVADLKKQPKEKKKVGRDKPMPSSSSKMAKVSSSKSSSSKKKGKKAVADDDVLTFDQKKDLSEAISRLEGSKLERVIQIIHEGVPEIRDSTEEIELEIDLLPSTVLTKLYNFVLRPLRAPTTKRSRPGKGTGTGGLKRKSMDEDVEAEKIRQLEQRMKLFDQDGSSGFPISAGNHSDGSSDSSSGSDSSGSDSE